jgi:hypothetical protein
MLNHQVVCVMIVVSSVTAGYGSGRAGSPQYMQVKICRSKRDGNHGSDPADADGTNPWLHIPRGTRSNNRDGEAMTSGEGFTFA